MQTVNIDFYRDPNPVVNDAYDRLMAKIPLIKAKTGSNLFTISGCEPGVGATTIAISISVSLSSSNWRTLLVDSDIRKDPHTKRLSQGIRCGLADYLMQQADLADIVCSTNIDKLHYISCGTLTENPVTLLNSSCLDKFIEEVASKYDYVIFDSPSLNATVDAAIIASKASGAILVAGHLQTKKGKVQSAVQEIERTGASVLGIVLNNIGRKEYKRYVENYDYFSRTNVSRRERKINKNKKHPSTN